MRATRSIVRVTAVSAALALTGTGVSYAALSTSEPSKSSMDGATDSAVVASHANHKHGGQAGHLPGSQENLRKIGEMRINQDQGGRVADVGFHDGYAYLAAFFEPNCQKGGVYVFDVRNPAAPKQINFIRTANDSYVGEGTQVIDLETEHFSGDLLIHNNEICAGSGNGTANRQAVGGISLVDVTNPKTHKDLALGFGDTRTGLGRAHTVHSAFAWQDGPNAYAVMVDNEESTDIDIVDITDPRNPVLAAEYDLNSGTKIVDGEAMSSGIAPVADTVKGDSESFHHDVVVKEINGVQTMLVSYWDGGYVTLNVEDPRNATYIGDTDFTAEDEQLNEAIADGRVEDPTPREPEGNAHQAEFNLTNGRILAADEDFAPFSFTASGARVGEFDANSGDGTVQIPEGSQLSGQTVFVGRACTGDAPVPAATGPNQIALTERGVCTFTEKVANISAAGGWAGVLVMNRTASDACNATLGMSVEGDLPAFGVIAREVGYDLLGIRDQYDDAECKATPTQATVSEPYTPMAPIGTVGDTVTFESYFDGWGYIRLIENGAGKMTELDTFAIPQAHDPDFATDFGDLSVHEVAFSDVNPNLAYVAYYSGGTRVLDISDDTITEVGHWIDEGGSNMWGVQVFEHEGKEYVAASDRDFGVQIFEYTGAGAPNTP